MSPARITLAVTAIFALVALLPGAAPPSEIARLVQELGDESFDVREAASKKLFAAGARAEPALLKALGHKDHEIAARAMLILREFKWGIYPDAPPRVVEWIRTYRSAALNDRRDIVRKMLNAGSDGCVALTRIARAEEDVLVREEVFAGLTANITSVLPGLLEENNLTTIDGLMELALAGESRAGVRHYAAYHLLTGQLPARIAEWEGNVRTAVSPKARHAELAYFHRARGDWARARASAVAADREDLEEALLFEQADWAELARNRRFPPTANPVRYIGYRAAYGRLGGDRQIYDVAVADLVQAGRIAAANGDATAHAKALFLNGKAGDAIELLQQAGGNERMLFEIFVARGKHKEALAVVEAAQRARPQHLATLEILEARMLHGLGEKERAVATLARYAGLIRPGVEVEWAMELLDAELALGRREAAFGLAARMLERSSDSRASGVFEKLWEKQEVDARQLWFHLMREQPKQPGEARLALLGRLLEGKGSEKEVKDFLDAAKIAGREKTSALLHALGEVALLAKRRGDAEHFFREAATCRAGIRLGDLLVEEKQWARAAAQFHAAYKLSLKERPVGRGPNEIEGRPSVALWLSGHALVQAGDAVEGKRRMERAHLLPLGDGKTRYDVARALRRRGHREAASREMELLRRLGEPRQSEYDFYYTGEGFRAAALEASARKDYLKAADGFEQTFLRCLDPDVTFTRAGAYVSVPAFMGVVRARGLAGKGLVEEALAECERVRGSVPGSVELTMYLVPELERLGRKKEADALYRAVLAEYEAVLRDWPGCAYACNQAAWMAACTRRDLEQGLVYARKAVELSPETPAYHDTLAEVLFQLGDKEKALAAEKQASALNPKRGYYQRQIRRMEAGDPKAPRPEEED